MLVNEDKSWTDHIQPNGNVCIDHVKQDLLKVIILAEGKFSV